MIIYLLVFIILLVAELIYFRIADKCNIIDKPNERSSHTTIVLRGGGVIFLIGAWVWSAFFGFQYPWFLAGMTLVAGVSLVDDIRSLPDSVRLVAQFAGAAMAFYELGLLHWSMWWMVIIALIVYVGATNVINFMDGINGITAGYALAVLVPLALVNGITDTIFSNTDNTDCTDVFCLTTNCTNELFFDGSLVNVMILAVVVFCLFNFRPKGKAKCFAGDVGSIGIAFVMLFLIGKVIMTTGDVTCLILLLVYGVDGCLTIIHRIMLHENLGQAHRKHAFQIMANELKIGHVKVTLLYMAMQTVVSMGFIYLCPNTAVWHWAYFVVALAILAIAYVIFMKKYYHLHEEYLASLK